MRSIRQLRLIRTLVTPFVAAAAVSVTAQSPFVEVLIPGQFTLGSAGGSSWGDFDNDGFMDFFAVVGWVSGQTGDDRLWRNEGNDHHWLKLVLKGTVSNASAIGAIVRVKATIGGVERWQMRQVFAGGKYKAQKDLRPNFGLREGTVAEVVRIEWPSGIVQELTNVPADQILTVVEPPRLKVESGGHISWPVTADGYQLESATTLDGTWSEASETVETNGSRKSITAQLGDGARFYRLKQH